MAYDLEEQESIDQMKAWWDQWGTPITAAVCVCCLGFAGWNGWQWYQRNQAAQASGAYVQLQNAIYQNDTKNVKSIADGLIEDYGTTIYAPLGALASAAAEVQEGNLDLPRPSRLGDREVGPSRVRHHRARSPRGRRALGQEARGRPQGA